jgi:hypothetical protein
MIYTSNYARKGQDPGAIAISVGLKEWNSHLLHMKELAPTWEMVNDIKNGSITENQYTEMYLLLLEERKFYPHKFVKQFPSDIDYYLLCYEPPNTFCHRRVLADYIEYNTGIVIPEWMNEKELKLSKQQEITEDLLQF